MTIRENELNLSLKEFQYYQECPQKFRLYRILNPIPTKKAFLKDRRNIEEYRHRGYLDTEIDGIELHLFFATFHQHYDISIYNNIVPSKLVENPIKLLFWKYQLKRYRKLEEKSYWSPIWKELQLMNKYQRGIIDCVEMLEGEQKLRLIDYKKKKYEKDQDALNFYALLLNHHIIEMGWDDLEIDEIGCYYYLEGELCLEKFTKNSEKNITDKIKQVLNQIKNENFCLNKEHCNSCQFNIICNVDQNRYNRR